MAAVPEYHLRTPCVSNVFIPARTDRQNFLDLASKADLPLSLELEEQSKRLAEHSVMI